MHDWIDLTQKAVNFVSSFLGEILQSDKKRSLFVLAKVAKHFWYQSSYGRSESDMICWITEAEKS